MDGNKIEELWEAASSSLVSYKLIPTKVEAMKIILLYDVCVSSHIAIPIGSQCTIKNK